MEVKLVLLNVVEDGTYKPTKLEEWEKHYKEVFENMTGFDNAPKDVALINFPTKNKE